MHPKSPLWLEDMLTSGCFIQQDTAELSHAAFLSDRRTRQAVERNPEIIGEALRRIERVDPQTAHHLTNHRQVIGLRNRLIHGYDEADDSTIWTIITTFLPVLMQEVETLLTEADTSRTSVADVQLP